MLRNGTFDWNKFFRNYSIVLILVGLIVLISILTGGVFLRVRNLLNVLRQVSVVAIIALGVTMVIITRRRPHGKPKKWCR